LTHPRQNLRVKHVCIRISNDVNSQTGEAQNDVTRTAP